MLHFFLVLLVLGVDMRDQFPHRHFADRLSWLRFCCFRLLRRHDFPSVRGRLKTDRRDMADTDRLLVAIEAGGQVIGTRWSQATLTQGLRDLGFDLVRVLLVDAQFSSAKQSFVRGA